MAGRDLLATPSKGRDLLADIKEPSIMDKAKEALQTTGDVLSSGFKRSMDAGPTSFLTLTGGLATQLGHDVKSVAMEKSGVHPMLAEAVSGATDPQSLVGGVEAFDEMASGAKSLFSGKSALDKLMEEKDAVLTGARDFLGGNKDVSGNPVPGISDVVKKADLASVNAKFTNLKNTLKQNIDVFLGKAEATDPKAITIPKIADEATINNRENYVALAKDISDNYGAARTSALKGAKVDAEDLHQALGSAIEEAGLFGKPDAAWSPSERAIINYYNNVGDSLPASSEIEQTIFKSGYPETVKKVVKGEPTQLEVDKVDSDLQRILQSRSGQKYGPGDHILTLVREKMDDVLYADNPALKVIRAKFKPLLQMKNEAYNIFQPFNRSGEFDTTRGVNFFSRYINGGLKPDEVRLIKGMQQKFGKDVFKNLDEARVMKNKMFQDLSALDQSHQGELAGVTAAHDEAVGKILTETENKVSTLDALIAKAEKDELKKNILKGGVVGASKLVGGGLLVGASIKGGEAIGKLLVD